MVFLPHSNSFLPFAKAVLNHKQCKITLKSWGQDPTNPFYWVQSRFVVLHSKRGLQNYLLEVFESYPELEHSVNSDLNPKQYLEIHFIWASSWHHCCPFLFLAYKPRQAQNPMTLTARPSRKAIVSPASMASTAGSTSSSEARARKNFEVHPVEDMLPTPQGS